MSILLKIVQGSVGVACCSVMAVASHAALVSIGPQNSEFIAFDEDATRGVGQTFTIDSTTSIAGFSFEARSTSATVDYRAYIYGWNAGLSSNTSTQYFAQTTTQAITSGAYVPIEVDTPGLELTPGDYIALLYTTDTAGSGQAYLGARDDDTYVDGGGFYTAQVRDPDNPAAFDPDWQSIGILGLEDFVFELVVPEPVAGMLIVGLGLACLGRRRSV